MKFNCGDRKERARLRYERDVEIAQELDKWRKWFAWVPVRVGKKDCRWLEFVERRGVHYYFSSELFVNHSPTFRGWLYRALEQHTAQDE